MKRIMLNLGVLVMLSQNVFANTDAEYDKLIANESSKEWKQSYKCVKETLNHPDTGNVNECLKSIDLQKKNPKSGLNIAITYLNTGVLYERSVKDYIKAYKYYIKAGKLGNTHSQSNLDILCNAHAWVCK